MTFSGDATDDGVGAEGLVVGWCKRKVRYIG